MISGDAPEEGGAAAGSVRGSAGTLHPTDEKRACVSDAATTSSAETVEPVPGHPVRRILIIVGTVICAAAFASVVGWDIRGWFSDLWNTVTSISVEYIIAAVIAMIVQTTATAFAWFSILRYGYPGEVRWMQVYAAYAACVAMNNVLPANLGTIVMFVMLTTVIASATFAGMLGGFMVQKIFFVLRGRVRLPLPLPLRSRLVRHRLLMDQGAPVGGRDPPRLGHRRDRADGASLLAEGLDVVGAGAGGGPDPGAPAPIFGRVFLPEFVAWVAGLCVVAIFLAAYAIPVTFHSVMTVIGSNSISNTVAVTPGGAGVNQAFNVAALSDVTNSQTATAYSIAQQLVSTAWSIPFALVLMIWVFGWGGGKNLVQQSYEEAKKKAEEQKADHVR